ncbi:MAG: glycosyltransferase family 2 protein [Candidatus Sumerlaeia bacterium]|nr:glycosyltransferase family 2 protein [Candidatus Sumerlaeia bacterium]
MKERLRTGWHMVTLLVFLALWYGMWRYVLTPQYKRHMAEVPLLGSAPNAEKDFPRVAALIPARNEEEALGFSLRTLGLQQGVELIVLAANDQSSDSTGAIADALAAEFPGRIQALHLNQAPPPGWMGKCNALHQAYRHVPKDVDWLLFSDADVLHEPNTLARAIAHAEEAGADLLTILPRLDCYGFWEHAALPLVNHVGMVFLQPEKVMDPESRKFAGIGAFTLVRRSAYDAIGGHEAIKGEIIDDMGLAWKVKTGGGRLVLCQDPGAVHLRMYSDLGSIFRGFRKNMTAGLDRPLLGGIFGALFFGFVYGAPLLFALGALGLVLGGSILGGLIVLATTGAVWHAVGRLFEESVAGSFRFQGWKVRLGYPLGGALMAATMLASTWEGAIRGKNTWRGRTLERPKQELRLMQ